jgi:hypothetical protein
VYRVEGYPADIYPEEFLKFTRKAELVHRLTNKAITKALTYRVDVDRRGWTSNSTKERTASYASQIEKLADPLLAPIQAHLNEVNGRARVNTISKAKTVLDCAIEVEVELRSKGVTTKHMKGMTVFLRHGAGMNGVSTGVHLEYRATGWFVTKIEKTYDYSYRRFVSVSPLARQDIIRVQTGCYGEAATRRIPGAQPRLGRPSA